MSVTNCTPLKTSSIPLITYNNKDKFSLKFIDDNGQIKPIKCIGKSSAPFEIYQPFPNDYFVIRKFTENNKSKYFLLNPKTGEVPKESHYGLAEVKIDKKMGRFIFRVFYAINNISHSFKIASRFSGTSTLKGDWLEDFPNITTRKKIELETISFDDLADLQNLQQPSRIEMTEIDPIKKPVGRPRKIVDPAIVIEKRPRGRPKGSKNKPKTVTAVVTEKAPQITTVTKPVVQNRWERPTKKVEPLFTKSAVKVKEIKRIVGGVYSDVFINGHKVLAQQLNVDAQLMLKERVLAVTVDIEAKDDKEIKLFFANGTQWQTKHKDRLTGKPVQIANVTDDENQLKIALYNGNSFWISERDAGLNTTHKFGEIEIKRIKALAERPMKTSKLNKPKSTVKTKRLHNTIEQKTAVNTPTSPQNINDKWNRLVKMESVPLALNKKAYNVYINDVAVVRKHSSVTVKTFFDGALLGIHGIDLQNVMGPSKAEWKLFMADKSRWLPRQDRSGLVYITDITETANELRVKLSNSKYIKLYYNEVIPFKHPKKYLIQR